jgi:glycosyltransferase involved in cell wall biosynthesis
MADAVSGLKGSGPLRGLRNGGRGAVSRRRLRMLMRQGDAARDRRDWREAACLYERVLQAHPSLHNIRVQLGHAYKELGDLEKASLNYHAVLRLTPSDDDLHLQIGHLEKLKGSLREAAAYYRKAIELNPANADASVEYYALAPKLGLPPLLSSPDSNHKELTKGRGTTGEAYSPTEDTSVYRAPATDAPSEHHLLGERLDWAEALGSGPRPKLLFVSDSLGTPIHARGIYHYSIALAEIFSDMGFEITLVIEKSPGYGLKRHTPKFNLSSQSLDIYESAEIHRYYNDNIFSFKWKYENRGLQFLTNKTPLLVRLVQRIDDFLQPRYCNRVDNASGKINFISSRSRHLIKFDRLLYVDRFYSTSMSRAANDLDPVGLSAAGYDIVIMDTPHYIRLKHIDRSHIFTVVHDLIPLHDALYEQGWRRIFLSKMRATLAARGNLIFVSEYTRSLFHNVFPTYVPRYELVLNPSIPKDWIEHAVPTDPGRGSAYIMGISQDRAAQRHDQIRARAARLADDPKACQYLIEQLDAGLRSWDGSLPYFATVTSDEPRKNISIFCKIAHKFIGRVNFVIIGQVDGNRYMNYEPELYSNLHFTGYLDDARKVDIFQHATGIIFPSFSEGFGIPIMEAALFGVPVICSNLKVFHEVTQNLALYFDPNSPDELALRIDEVLASPTTHAETARILRETVSRRFSQDVMRRRLQQTLSEIGIPARHTP